MSYWGIYRGVSRVFTGVAEADPEAVIFGLVQTAAGTMGAFLNHLGHDGLAQPLSDYSENRDA